MKLFNKLKAFIATTLALCSAYGNTSPIYSTTIEGENFSFAQIEAATFYRPAGNHHDFWSFCAPYNCYGYGTPGVTQELRYNSGISLSTPTDMFANMHGYRYFPYIDVETLAFPKSQTRPKGKLVFSTSTDEGLLSGLPEGQSAGFVLSESFQWYAFPDKIGMWEFSVNTDFFNDQIPNGYLASITTHVDVGIYASWANDAGKLESFNQSVYSNSMTGSANFIVSLPSGLSSYAIPSDVPYATYSVLVRQELTLTASPVPEASIGMLCLAGLLAIALSRQGLVGLIPRPRRAAA